MCNRTQKTEQRELGEVRFERNKNQELVKPSTY